MSGINALGGGVLGYLIPFLFVLTVVVFFHELGHFLVARWCGVRVLVFSIGFGPELFGFNDRHGTRWKLCAIPLGGYVKFFGDDNAASVPDQAAIAAMSEEERQHSFIHQPVGPRAAIVVAGPAANFVLAIAIFAGSVHDLRQAEHVAAGRRDPARQRGRGGRLPAGRPGPFDQWAAGRELSRTCSRSSAPAPARR